MTPSSYTYKAGYKSTKEHYSYGAKETGLSYDVEYSVVKVI